MISAKPMAMVAMLTIGGAVVAGLWQTGRAWFAVPPPLGEHSVRDSGSSHGQVPPTPSSLGGSREKAVQESVARSELETGSQLQGTVRGGDESPVPSADVWIEILVNGALDRVAACRSNERGAFILDLSFISGMTPAEFQEANPTLCAWGPGHALERDELGDLVDLRNFLREQEGEPWDIELEWGGDVFGRVVDRGGRPVPGAVVRSSWGSTVTDLRGTYRFGKTGMEGVDVWDCDFEARESPGGTAMIEGHPVGKFGSTRIPDLVLDGEAPEIRPVLLPPKKMEVLERLLSHRAEYDQLRDLLLSGETQTSSQRVKDLCADLLLQRRSGLDNEAVRLVIYTGFGARVSIVGLPPGPSQPFRERAELPLGRTKWEHLTEQWWMATDH